MSAWAFYRSTSDLDAAAGIDGDMPLGVVLSVGNL
jgi:hypothetical protein